MDGLNPSYTGIWSRGRSNHTQITTLTVLTLLILEFGLGALLKLLLIMETLLS